MLWWRRRIVLMWTWCYRIWFTCFRLLMKNSKRENKYFQSKKKQINQSSIHFQLINKLFQTFLVMIINKMLFETQIKLFQDKPILRITRIGFHSIEMTERINRSGCFFSFFYSIFISTKIQFEWISLSRPTHQFLSVNYKEIFPRVLIDQDIFHAWLVQVHSDQVDIEVFDLKVPN